MTDWEEAKNLYTEEIAKIYNLPPAVFSPTGTWKGDIEPIPPADPEPLPEHLCGNCRRDWHNVPLTETVAGMYYGLFFDEDYDPNKDVSRVVCPGSDCCGPAVNFRGYRTGTIITSAWSSSPWVTYHDASPVEKTYANIKTLNQLMGKEWFDANPDLAGEGWHDIGTLAEDTVQQAALEAAPKAIEMKHKPPEPIGFDFSGWDGKPAYYTYMKGKKK
jgi:hypothetical protein